MSYQKLFSRPTLGWSALAVVAIALLAGPALSADPSSPRVTPRTERNRQGRQVSLYDQLRVGLKAVTKQDFEFIEEVVDEVDAGRLPRQVVDATFLWARNRYKSRPQNHRLRPMVYFRPGMIEQAKRFKVLL